MRQRCLEVIGMAVVIMAVSGLLKLAPVTVAGQAPTATAQSGAEANTAPAPRTSWGEPDLQGIWRDDYQIPLQRPARYANQEFFTDEERAALDEQRLAVSRFGDVGLAPRGTEQDVGGAYNAVFTSQRHTGRRTSMIVDPPDGRMPPLTPEAQKRRDVIGEYQLALLQATDVCKNDLPGCVGGPVRAAVTEASGDASVLPDDGPRWRPRAWGRGWRHQSLRRSRGARFE